MRLIYGCVLYTRNYGSLFVCRVTCDFLTSDIWHCNILLGAFVTKYSSGSTTVRFQTIRLPRGLNLYQKQGIPVSSATYNWLNVAEKLMIELKFHFHSPDLHFAAEHQYAVAAGGQDGQGDAPAALQGRA